jgi:hypothetical protein
MRKVWNAFRNESQSEEVRNLPYSGTVSYSPRPPGRIRLPSYSERSIVSSIYTRLAIDVASLEMRHILTDDKGRYKENVDSALNDCLIYEPNLDQSPRALRQDIALTLFDHGVAAIVPVDTTVNPETNEVYDILSLRVGEITQWYPRHVKVSVYNENIGERQEIIIEKKVVAIVENPLYSVMNEPNSTLQRLIKKLSILDSVDEAAGSGKLDIIIQLPYTIKSESRRLQAEQRREDIEMQLKGSQYGIAYADATEKITQLNRPAENNLLKQIEYLTVLLYNQLGLTEEVMNGTADESAMQNYYTRTIEPICDAIIESMQRAFLGPLKTKNHEKIKYFRDQFKLVAIKDIAEIADKLGRNEVASSNEIRGWVGLPPDEDPKSDELRNSNMPQPEAPQSDQGVNDF